MSSPRGFSSPITAPLSSPMRPAPATETGVSVRARLAQIALDSALATAGVVRAEPTTAGAYRTVGPAGATLAGVSCAAETGGGYSVSLRLVARMVPLHPLAETISVRTHATAQAAGLGDALRGVSVTFADIESAPAR